MKKNKVPSSQAPLFSVVIPLFNKKGYLRRSLNSVLNQTFQNFEVIVVDDGSTDQGSDMVLTLKDRRVKLITQKNAGVSVARNRGVEAARGPYVAFLDADDEWDPDYLDSQKDLIATFPGAGLYATNYRIHDGKGTLKNSAGLAPESKEKFKGFFHLARQERLPFHTTSVVLPAAVARENPFPPGIKSGEDLYVWFLVSLKHEVAYFNRPLTHWYLQTEGNAHDRYFGPAYHLDWPSLGKRMGRETPLSPDAKRFIEWIDLAQAKKMILSGYHREALGRLLFRPRLRFPGRQAFLLLLALSKFLRPGETSGAAPRPSRPVPAGRKAGRASRKTPFFSVVIPVYNKKNYLQRSFGSVLGQGFGDFEVIVVDDGSKDGSPAVVRSFKDKRIKLIVQKNAGVSAARNRGVEAARGQYITFLDADDDWDRDYLATIKGLIEEFPGAGLYGVNYRVDNGRRRTVNPVALPPGWRGRMRDYYEVTYRSQPPFCTDTVCLPAPLAKAIPFPPGIKAGEDLLVWFKASLEHDTVYWNKPLSTYYVSTMENAHATYFGPRYHLDWLEVGEQLKQEGLLSGAAQKYVIWATLMQARKMVANGLKREALAKWWRCPKLCFPLHQATVLILMALPAGAPGKVREILKRFWKKGV